MRGFLTSVLLLVTSMQSPLCPAEFAGWQGLRVIEQNGRPRIMRVADLDGDSREELIVVNSRSSRLDIYSTRASTANDADSTTAGLGPNELPLSPDIEHQELQLERVPRDVLVQDLDGDGHPELVVLTSSPNQILVYRREAAEDDDSGAWEKQFDLDLLEGDLASRHNALLLRPLDTGGFQVMVSMGNGIQQLTLQPGASAEWLTPHENRDRVAWWLADLDGDGNEDLIEQTRESNESVRWYKAAETGTLTPAAVLRDRAVQDVEVLRTKSAAQLVVLDSATRGILRRYKLARGLASPFGEQRPLALKDGPKAVWTGMWQGDKRALVVADSSAPRLLSYTLGDAGWESQQAYPALTDIRALTTLAGESGTLLLWTKDAADLQKSRWEEGRLSYPKPWPQSETVEDRKILALDSVGSITWWVQKVGKHLDLYVARPQAAEPARTRFPDVGAKADQVLWLGGDRLLVKETHGRDLKLFTLDGEKANVSAPTHLKKASLEEFHLFHWDEGVRVGRLTDGVLQWLGDDLRSREQIMLPQGLELASYVADDETRGWALQRDSPFVHRIEIDDSRLSKSIELIKLDEGTALLRDPVLGMLLLGQDRLTQLSEGRPWELKLIEVIDDQVARAGGVRKTRFHRLSTTDIDRNGTDDLVLVDELQHRLTVLGVSEADSDAERPLAPIIAWPVFDDKVYPYNDKSDNLVKEPRAVIAGDFDGDRLQDLAILCHDRLIIYLAREKS